MRILIVNDDSIHAPGIALLARAAAALGEVTVVAPAHQCSAMSQRITIGKPMELRRIADFPAPVKAAWSLDGTPADCVKAAIRYIMEEKPDIVFSGINEGWNIGFDIVHSGTLGAAFEARMLGVPAVAFSNAQNADWTLPEKHLTAIARACIERELPPDEVWNVNFPAVFCGTLWDRYVAPMQLHREWFETRDGGIALVGECRTDPAGLPAGSDLEAVLRGCISVGPVKCAVLENSRKLCYD